MKSGNTATNEEFYVVLNYVHGDAVSASRIIAGALWLDQVDGDWWSEARFNLDRFDINHPGRCVLGQVVAGECNGQEYRKEPFYMAVYDSQASLQQKRNYLGAGAAKFAIHEDVAKTLGFHLLDEERDDWGEQMNRGWYALIAHRQGREDKVHPRPFGEH